MPVYATASRALIILALAAGLLRSTRQLPIAIPLQWNAWVAANVVLLLLLPLLLGYVTLSDPPQEFGWRRGEARWGAQAALALYALMVPVLVLASRLPELRTYYQSSYLPPTPDAGSALALAATTTLYMFAWEFFFRGFLLFGLRPALGSIAVMVQALIFMSAHLGKPNLEVAGSLFAGLALGGVCWRANAFWPGFVTHALCHATWNLLVTR